MRHDKDSLEQITTQGKESVDNVCYQKLAEVLYDPL